MESTTSVRGQSVDPPKGNGHGVRHDQFTDGNLPYTTPMHNGGATSVKSSMSRIASKSQQHSSSQRTVTKTKSKWTSGSHTKSGGGGSGESSSCHHDDDEKEEEDEEDSLGGADGDMSMSHGIRNGNKALTIPAPLEEVIHDMSSKQQQEKMEYLNGVGGRRPGG